MTRKAAKRLLITGAGGAPATNFVRSLKVAPEQFHLVGTDSNEFYLQRAETDVRLLVPSANEPAYIDVLNQVIDEHGCEFIHVQNDAEMQVVSKNRARLKAATFLPAAATVETCLNKYETYSLWNKAGLKQPATVKIDNEEDLRHAFGVLKGKIWFRETSGAGGRGAILTDDRDFVKAWITFRNAWGKFSASEYLSPDSVTWMSIWNDGELVVAQSRKRLYWELGKIAPTGVTGVTGAGVTIDDKQVDEIATRAILAVDSKPRGIFSVDLTYDRDNVPNPTEINIGRFFTTHEFFTRAGLNMPYIYLKVAFKEQVPPVSKKVNPLPVGLVWIRGVDFLPVLTTVDDIGKCQRELKERLEKKGRL